MYLWWTDAGHLPSEVKRLMEYVALSGYARIPERRSCVYSVMMKGVREDGRHNHNIIGRKKMCMFFPQVGEC